MTTIPATTIYNPRTLAAFLSEHGLPGQRSMTAITKLRRERGRRRETTTPILSVADRAMRRLRDRAVAEIERRGGETEIYGEKGRVNASLDIVSRDRATGMLLLAAEGWRYYSSRAGAHRASLAFLYGTDDAGPWAVRVPGTITSVAAALEYITPAEVAKARRAGRRVWRQGDIYAIETTKAHDGKGAADLPEAHEWRPQTRFLVHRPTDGHRHRPLKLSAPVRFVRQRALDMARTGRGAYGD